MLWIDLRSSLFKAKYRKFDFKNNHVTTFAVCTLCTLHHAAVFDALTAASLSNASSQVSTKTRHGSWTRTRINPGR